MKIQTHNKNQHSKNIQFGTTVVVFDQNGVAEVEAELAAEIIEKHPLILKFGESLPEPEMTKGDLGGTYDELKSKLSDSQKEVFNLKLQLKRKEEDFNLAQMETTEWKNLYEKTEKEVEALRKAMNLPTAEKTLTSEPQFDAPLDSPADEFTVELNSKTVKELQDVCAGLNLPKSNWNSLSKQNLIAYIVENTK